MKSEITIKIITDKQGHNKMTGRIIGDSKTLAHAIGHIMKTNEDFREILAHAIREDIEERVDTTQEQPKQEKERIVN